MYDPVEGQISDVRGYDQKKIEVLGFGLSFPVSFFLFISYFEEWQQWKYRDTFHCTLQNFSFGQA